MSDIDGADKMPTFHTESPDANETVAMCIRAMTATAGYANIRPERSGSLHVAFTSLIADLVALATELDIAVLVRPTSDAHGVGHAIEMTTREQWETTHAPSDASVADALAAEAAAWLAELAEGGEDGK